jgi:hypothetical protein
MNHDRCGVRLLQRIVHLARRGYYGSLVVASLALVSMLPEKKNISQAQILLFICLQLLRKYG